jgi:hypothetical protein
MMPDMRWKTESLGRYIDIIEIHGISEPFFHGRSSLQSGSYGSPKARCYISHTLHINEYYLLSRLEHYFATTTTIFPLALPVFSFV